MALLAFFTVLFGLVAVMLSALFNGLVLPLYVTRQLGQTGVNLDTVRLIVQYGSAINRSLSYAFMAAISIGIGIWSGLILQTRFLPRWLGYGGLLLIGIVGLGMIAPVGFTAVAGFRLLVSGLVIWMILVGYALSRQVPASIPVD